MKRVKSEATPCVFGIDIGKNTFHLVGLDQAGQPITRLKFRRDTLLEYFARLPKVVIGMEACPGAQWLARKHLDLGHSVKVIPAQFVKPYVKSNKNDLIDAEAIAEAVSRPTMRFASVKNTAQIDMQSLHRIRDQMVGTRTRLISQMRAFCLEYGIAIHQGPGKFKQSLPQIIADAGNDLTPMMRRLLGDLFADLQRLELRLQEVSREIEANAANDDAARRLMSIPGVGPLTATALLAALGEGLQFRRARDMAAWLGLTPKQHSTGGKTTLLGISKRGNGYVRRLMIHGARACFSHMNKARDRLGVWIDSLLKRMHPNKVIIALAAKIARIAWVILNKPGSLYSRQDPILA